MVEIIEKKWSKSEIAIQIGKALQEKAGLEAMESDTTDVNNRIAIWKEKFNSMI